MNERTTSRVAKTLSGIALKLPAVEVGVACKGTAVESTTYRTRDKAFLFVGAGVARLKLNASLNEAVRLAGNLDCKVGAHGWVALSLTGNLPPPDVVQRWIQESHRLVGGAQPAADERAHARSKPQRETKKKSARKTTRRN